MISDQNTKLKTLLQHSLDTLPENYFTHEEFCFKLAKELFTIVKPGFDLSLVAQGQPKDIAATEQPVDNTVSEQPEAVIEQPVDNAVSEQPAATSEQPAAIIE